MKHAFILACQDVDILRRKAFTLIEVLIVVVIVALLAGTVISYSAVSTLDAKQSAMKHNLYVLKTQIELYRADHLGQVPAINNNRWPQLNGATNTAGESGLPGPDYPYGPYLLELPVNPYDGQTRVTAVANPGQQPATIADPLGGWQYDESTGAVWPNNPECYSQH